MCEAKRKILVTIPVTDAQREELAAAGGEDCILTFLPESDLILAYLPCHFQLKVLRFVQNKTRKDPS